MSVKKLLMAFTCLVLLSGCASQANAAMTQTSTENASVESVSSDGAVLKTDADGKSKSITVDNDDHVVIIRQRKTISPASLIPGEKLEITYCNGTMSTISVLEN